MASFGATHASSDNSSHVGQDTAPDMLLDSGSLLCLILLHLAGPRAAHFAPEPCSAVRHAPEILRSQALTHFILSLSPIRQAPELHALLQSTAVLLGVEVAPELFLNPRLAEACPPPTLPVALLHVPHVPTTSLTA
eukprot:scaffold175306_cov16-Tisochrysis_lutea.AAC.1